MHKKEEDEGMGHKTTHEENIIALKRIEGQVKGLQRMIEEGQYCIDIVTQMHAAINALHRVAERVLVKHVEHCVVSALRGKSETEKKKKIDEVLTVIKKLRKIG